MKKVSLGPLEQEIMGCVLDRKRCTVRDVFTCVSRGKDIAYNTVQTVMTRLIDKGLLKRTLQGKSHIYQPRGNRKNILKSAISQPMRIFMKQFGEEALIAFLDDLDEISEDTRQKLIEKLQKK